MLGTYRKLRIHILNFDNVHIIELQKTQTIKLKNGIRTIFIISHKFKFTCKLL